MSISPLPIRSVLHDAPQSSPKYPITVNKSDGKEAICGDPDVSRALVALMDLHAVNGGAASHWGGPAAVAEAMSAVHSIMFEESEWHKNFNFVNDIGHGENGIYGLRANLGFGDLNFDAVRGFRSLDSKLTGHGESHLYPEGVLLSNGPLSSSLPQAQGLAIADKVTGNSRVTINVLSDGACMEGEAKEAFASIPGFAQKGKMNPFVMIVSDNNTKLSGRIDADSFSMEPTFSCMEALGWNVVKVEQGNDLQACYTGIESSIEKARNGKAPVCVWLKTVKGYGVKATAEHAGGGHGFPIKPYSSDIVPFIKEIFNDNAPEEFVTWANELTNAPEKKDSGVFTEKMQAGLARGVIKACEDGKPVFSISSDLQGSTGMAAFQKKFPERSIDVGIAEANMVSIGVGMSRAGYIPIVDTFAAFGVTKGNLPLIMSALSSCPQISVFSHTGFQDAADGASHQSLTYLSAVSSIPYTEVVNVSCAAEAETLIQQAISEIEMARIEGRAGNSFVFFLGRENFPTQYVDGLNYELGKAQVLESGDACTIVASGPTVPKALKAAAELKAEGISVSVINTHSINSPDLTTITSELKKSGKLVTVEDHQVIGGMGSQLIHKLQQAGESFKSHSLGVKGTFGQSSYTADGLYAKHGLDEVGIIAAVRKLLV